MATLLQLHFAFNGPLGDAMAKQLKPLAESINQGTVSVEGLDRK